MQVLSGEAPREMEGKEGYFKLGSTSCFVTLDLLARKLMASSLKVFMSKNSKFW